MKNILINDKIICINNKSPLPSRDGYLKIGKIYIVKKWFNHNLVKIEGEKKEWNYIRFINIKNIPNYKIVAFKLTNNLKYLK